MTSLNKNYTPVEVEVAPMAWAEVFVVGLVFLAGAAVVVGFLAGLATLYWAAGGCGVVLMALILITEQRRPFVPHAGLGDGRFLCGCGELIDREAVMLFDELAVCPRCHAQMTSYRERVQAADRRAPYGSGNEAA